MGKIKLADLLGIVSVLSTGTVAETAQVQSWTTAVKISCDNSVAEAHASNILLCEDALCSVVFPAGGVDCGGGVRSDGHRFDTPFKPTVFSYTLEVMDQGSRLICSNVGDGMPMGTTVTCDGSNSPKLTVGRPH